MTLRAFMLRSQTGDMLGVLVTTGTAGTQGSLRWDDLDREGFVPLPIWVLRLECHGSHHEVWVAQIVPEELPDVHALWHDPLQPPAQRGKPDVAPVAVRARVGHGGVRCGLLGFQV